MIVCTENWNIQPIGLFRVQMPSCNNFIFTFKNIDHVRTNQKFEGNILAMEVIEGFTETDEKLAQKFFQSKLDEAMNMYMF